VIEPHIGHNSRDVAITVEVRLFNSLAKFLPKKQRQPVLEFEPGSTIADILRRMDIPDSEVFLALCNGRDVTPNLDSGICTDYELDEGDVIALSGPIPYSWGYGAPVV
jgi:sulfur carrier protein ThiS